MDTFANGLNVPTLQYTRNEHPLRAPIRRITQGLGLLSNNVFGAQNLSSVELHTLAKLREHPNSILAKTVVAVSSLPANTVAGIIKRLIDRGLIILKTAVAGLKMAHLPKIALAFEFSVLTLTVPGLRLRKVQNPVRF